jgi:hypothetical protein
MGWMSLSSQSRSARASLLTSAMNSPLATFNPAALPPVKPLFSASSTTLTEGKFSLTRETEPSADPLSTRMISQSA